MTGALADRVIDAVLQDEGGLSNHADDRGGLTHFGLTKPFLSDVTGRDWSDEGIRQMSVATARSVFRLWMGMRRLDQLPEDYLLAWVVTDYAVHSGSRVAIKAVQTYLGCAADGIAGAETQARWHRLAEPERRALVAHVLAARLELIGAWITKTPSQAVFAKGVMRRIAHQVRACA